MLKLGLAGSILAKRVLYYIKVFFEVEQIIL